jgi:hypothetical protein
LRKKFSQEQYDQDDAPAKKAVQKFLFKKWKSISINGGQYDVDLKCFRDGKIVTYVEVERRHNWKRDFEWQTIHVPERKRKFFVLDKPTYIFSVRSDLKRLTGHTETMSLRPPRSSWTTRNASRKSSLMCH